MMEAVAFGTELILENMRKGGYHPDSLTLAGAPATNITTNNSDNNIVSVNNMITTIITRKLLLLYVNNDC
jgi:ribulose kinase